MLSSVLYMEYKLNQIKYLYFNFLGGNCLVIYVLVKSLIDINERISAQEKQKLNMQCVF